MSRMRDCPICSDCGFGLKQSARWRNGQLNILLAGGMQDFDPTCIYCSFLQEVLCRFITTEERKRIEGYVLKLQLNQGTLLKLTARWYRNLYASDCALDLSLVLYVENDLVTIPQLPKAAAYCERPDGITSFDFLRQSLQTCRSDHQQGLCGPRRPTLLPTRLLKLDETDPASTRLIDTNELDRGFYAALSYCWGDGLPLKLTSATRSTFQQGIEWQSLPTVFQDAVKVCRELSIYLLWTDSLCIDQESAADWARESAKMDQYYESATFTISASTSSSCSMPFLGPRNPDCSPYRFSLQLDDSNDIEIFARRMMTRPTEVLETRAWTFQENLLSQCIIDFSSVDLIWRCRELESSMYHQPARWDDYRKQFKEFQDFLSDTSAEKKYKDEDNRLFWLMHWSDMVKVYTKRNLTYATDRLPAFGGIAKRFQAKTQFTYTAGLWKELLPEALIWRKWPTSTPPEGYRIPDDYIAPSWSWASVRGHVTNFITTDYPPIPLAEGAVVIGVECKPANEANPFGQVKTGRLTMEGKLSPVIITFDRSAQAQPYRISFTGTSISFNPDSALIYSAGILRRARESDPEAISFSAPASCVLMGAGARANELPYRWLLILSQLGRGQYTRLGLLYLQEHREKVKMFADAEMFAAIDKGSQERIEIV